MSRSNYIENVVMMKYKDVVLLKFDKYAYQLI